MIGIVDTLSRLLTRAGERLWELGVSLELWCDEQHWRKVNKGEQTNG